MEGHRLARRPGAGAPEPGAWPVRHPKSRRGSRAVPLADRVAGELERHFQRSPLQDDDDLVFAHPLTGGPLDPSKV